MRFYAVRTEAIELTHQALQKLDEKRTGSRRPSRALRVATLYGHLQCRAQGGQPIRLGCRELASAWHLQPRELRADLQDLAAIGWLSYTSSSSGLCIRLHDADAVMSAETEGQEGASAADDRARQDVGPREGALPLVVSESPERRAAASDWISRFTALYNAHKPAAWPACNSSCAVLASRLQQAILQAGGAEAFWAVLIRALRGMPEFWRHTYPEGRSGVECASALLKVDRGSEGRGVEHWHVFCWGDGVDVGGDVAGAAAGESDLQKAHRLLYWSRDHWHGRGIETSKLDRREKWRLAELLEAEGEGTPGTAAEQFSQPPRQH
ncbi:hypothetical protein SynWH8101_1022 [Synechococcus sp. WH 8101]|uniref:hypothetical protein n=1 Tax=Synechococcus sp. WH 8101 TaxID=59932 RepID=UPI001023CF8A|nr:hypothetical protein [Synechococcus sp. WH 8101]QBE68610.1 hypothetical protein SynWH8101_1022 [Synechococcus sp. WH 8101]QNI44829.1 hypothetical protein SynRCC2555_01043 [Synechococcus sp. WH 8101]